MFELNYEKIIARIEWLSRKKMFDDALEICDLEQYKNDEIIQSEKIFLLLQKKKDVEAAYKAWEQFKDSDNTNIVINGINILMQLNRYEEALEYANLHKTDTIKYMRVRAKLLAALDKKDELLEIKNDPKYALDEVITRAYRKVFPGKKIVDEGSVLLTKIYADKVTKEEIKESNLDFYTQSLLLLAYYEKHNPKLGIELIKKNNKNDISDKYVKVYNTILQRLVNKKSKIFDITIYANLLNRSVDFNLVSELNDLVEEESNSVIERNDIMNIKEELKNREIEKETMIHNSKRVKAYIEIIGNKVNSRFDTTTNKSEMKVEKKEKVLLIKDVLASEVNELGQYIYVLMQEVDTKKNAIKAWDNLENIIYKPVTDKKALEKIINILIKISNSNPEIVSVDNKKLMKLLDK